MWAITCHDHAITMVSHHFPHFCQPASGLSPHFRVTPEAHLPSHGGIPLHIDQIHGVRRFVTATAENTPAVGDRWSQKPGMVAAGSANKTGKVLGMIQNCLAIAFPSQIYKTKSGDKSFLEQKHVSEFFHTNLPKNILHEMCHLYVWHLFNVSAGDSSRSEQPRSRSVLFLAYPPMVIRNAPFSRRQNAAATDPSLEITDPHVENRRDWLPSGND